MRFIFGLIAGAVTTLLVATALDAPTEDVLARATASWQTVSSHFTTPATPATATAPPSGKTSARAGTSKLDPEPEPEPEFTEISAPPSASQQLPAELRVQAEPQGIQVVDAMAADTAGEAVVWSPFHSEASATGFASRLSRQLAHPFEVRKQGPARYVVVYSFDSESQRLALQQQISKVTGVSSS